MLQPLDDDSTCRISLYVFHTSSQARFNISIPPARARVKQRRARQSILRRRDWGSHRRPVRAPGRGNVAPGDNVIGL
jgi:hypothetical protein